MKKRLAFIAMMSLAIGCSHSGKHHEEEEEGEAGGEVKMTLAEVPAPVRDTLVRAADGQTVKSVDKETSKSGAIVYETDVKSGGKTWEIRVAPDGKLISKKPESDEEDEKAEKKEKHGKDKEDKD